MFCINLILPSIMCATKVAKMKWNNVKKIAQFLINNKLTFSDNSETFELVR